MERKNVVIFLNIRIPRIRKKETQLFDINIHIYQVNAFHILSAVYRPSEKDVQFSDYSFSKTSSLFSHSGLMSMSNDLKLCESVNMFKHRLRSCLF